MSWEAYVTDHLMCQLPGGGQLAHSAIWGQDGGIWAQDEGFPPVKPGEIAALVAGFLDPTNLAQNGLWIGGEKYLMVQGEPGKVLRGKKGPGGCTLKKTKTAVVVGIYDEGVPPGECNVIVEGLGDYLLESGL